MAGITYPSYTYPIMAAWAGDFFDADDLMPAGGRLDVGLFFAPVTVAVTGAVAANATTLPVTALTGDITQNTTLNFTGNKPVRVQTPALKGATSINVYPIPVALVGTDTAVYSGPGTRQVLSGICVGRTYAERNASAPFGPAADTDDEIYLVAFAVPDVSRDADVTLVRPGDFIVKENLLPVAPSAAVLTKLRQNYVCIYGNPT